MPSTQRGLLLVVIAAGACGGDDGLSVSGHAFRFNGAPGNEGRLAGATVSIVEDPGRQTMTAVDGAFRFDGFAAGDQVTLALEAADHHRIQTATFTLDASLERVTFQVVHDAIYASLADLLGVVPDEANRCQVVTTVTRAGRSLYDPGAHGEADATATMAPNAAGEGPIYFDASVLPDRALDRTTEDGGVLFTQVPPGEYTLEATKAGVTFRPARILCRAGWLVNASPPWGLQVI